MTNFLKALARDDEGASLVEYAMLVSLIAFVCIGVVTTFGTQVQTLFQTISSAFP